MRHGYCGFYLISSAFDELMDYESFYMVPQGSFFLELAHQVWLWFWWGVTGDWSPHSQRFWAREMRMKESHSLMWRSIFSAYASFWLRITRSCNNCMLSWNSRTRCFLSYFELICRYSSRRNSCLELLCWRVLSVSSLELVGLAE